MTQNSDIRHFWSPPRPGEKIIDMREFRGIIVVVTTEGVYTIGEPSPEWQVQQIEMK